MVRRNRNEFPKRLLVAFCSVLFVLVGASFALLAAPFESGLLNAPDDELLKVSDKTVGVVDDADTSLPEAPGREDASSYASNRLLLTVDAEVGEQELVQSLSDQGVDVTDVSIVSDSLSDGSALVAVDYAGDQDPAVLSETLVLDEVVLASEPDYIVSIDVYEGLDDESGDQGESAEGNSANDAGSAAVESVYDPQATINDSYQSKQWGLTAIGAYSAWDTIKASGAVTVVVIDTGVDYDHPDLKNNLILDYAKNTYTEAVGGVAVDDTVGHGTHVAGIIAASTNNSTGVAGVSYNAKILPIKASFNSDGQMNTSDVIEGIDYVISLKQDPSSPSYLKNIRVINMSLGGPDYSSYMASAIARAEEAGILCVASAGNEGADGESSAWYPASCDGVLAVAALKQTSTGVGYEVDTSYSNYGPYVDISAPGTSIYSTVPSGSYSNKTGTSMAAPMVAGVAALNYALNMEQTPDEVSQVLISTAKDINTSGWDKRSGYGAVQAAASVKYTYNSIANLSNAAISSIGDQEYTGKAIYPSVSVSYGSKTLDAGTDYTISYSNNVAVGLATVTVTGKGYYRGTNTATFRILDTSADARSVSVGKPVAATDLVYTGEEQLGVIEPEIVSNVVTVGDGSVGQLGTGGTSGSLKLAALSLDAVYVAAGGDHSAAITSDGSLYLWGLNDAGQIGDGTTINRTTPVKVLDNVAQVALGVKHSAALTKDGDLYLWGSNAYGQIGDGTTVDRLSPVRVMRNVASVDLGGYSSAAIAKGGTLYTWGHFQAAGRGKDATCFLLPDDIIANVAEVSLGFANGAAVTLTGRMYTWGLNDSGQLGNGTTTSVYTPQSVATGVKSVEVGRINTAYVDSNGRLYMTGKNTYGQIGDGTTVDRTSFVCVLDKVASVSLGYSSAAAVRTDGTLLTWGSGSSGRLATGSTSNVVVPTAVLAGVEQAELGSGYLIIREGRPYELSGDVSAVLPGDYTAVAKLRSGARWTDGSTGDVVLNWSIYAPYDLSGVKFEDLIVTYDAKPHSITVSGTLPAGVSVYYEGNSNVNAGTYEVTAKFRADSPIPDMKATLTIERASISSYCKAYSISSKAYTGYPVEPGCVLFLASDKNVVLEEGVDYDISYEDNVNIGTARVVVAGKGNYIGGGSLTFDIVDRSGVLRLAGGNRYGTMQAIAFEGFDNGIGGWAVVASGANFPDALAASSLAGALDAPVILTDPKSLSAEAENQLRRTGVSNVVVVGGPNTVSSKVFEQIADLPGVSVERVYGDNRLATSLAIYSKGLALGVDWSDTALVATGASFADALSISPYAYATKSPIFLSDSKSGLSNDAIAAIRIGGFSRGVIVGGAGSVPALVQDELASAGLSWERVSGENRYETSVKIADWAEAEGALDASFAGLATGANFPDALAGGALCGARGSVLLLASSASSPALTWLDERAGSVTTTYILGGTGSVSAAIEDAVRAML